jgi:hypothetical protein
MQIQAVFSSDGTYISNQLMHTGKFVEAHIRWYIACFDLMPKTEHKNTGKQIFR